MQCIHVVPRLAHSLHKVGPIQEQILSTSYCFDPLTAKVMITFRMDRVTIQLVLIFSAKIGCLDLED